MSWVARGFIFRKVDSPIHHLDPRVRLAITIEFFVLSLMIRDLVELGITFGSVLTVAAVAKIIPRLLRTLAFSASFAVLIFVINIFATTTTSEDPVVESAVLALRFVAVIASTSLFFLTTSPDEFEYVLKWMRVPRDVVFAFVTAVRFVPVLMLDAIQIMDAQKSRGLELERGNYLKRIRKFTPILVPLVVSAVIRSGELAEAMESRAYGVVKKPTSLYELRMSARDGFFLALSVLIFSLIAYFFLVR